MLNLALMTRHFANINVLWMALIVVSCSSPSAEHTSPIGHSSAEAQAPVPHTSQTDAGSPTHASSQAQVQITTGSCSHPIKVFRDGQEVGQVCEENASVQNLTIIDLSDDWAPFSFRAPSGHEDVHYRRTLVALADERAVDENGHRVSDEQYLELFGIFPTFRVLRERITATSIAQCDAAVDNSPLDRFEGVLRRSGRNATNTASMERSARTLRSQLQREATRRQLSSIEELSTEASWQTKLERLHDLEGFLEIIATVQKHLKCEGLLDRYHEGVFDGVTSNALTQWQRKNMLVSRGYFDEHSRDIMKLPYEERMFQSALRSLRERVVDATGLIEDGTASAQSGQVIGRSLNAPELEATYVYGALPNGAPDLISAATDVTAKALGWTEPSKAIEWIKNHTAARMRVAISLPPLPAYYNDHMELRAEIDRGDVRRGHNVEGDRRPTTTVFVRTEGRDIPLVRWSTTIGGFQSEQLSDGEIVTRYKESPAGPRIWRDVIAGPSWLPPPSTPDSEIARGAGRVNHALLGPSYRSAYGLLMVMHHKVLPPDRNGQRRFHDEGVRSHGSVSYHSMLSGFSHGCHRLFNHLALRLGGFLIRHRHHTVHGNQAANYSRVLQVNGQTLGVHVDSRGYLYELTPPVDVNVLEGNVHF